MRKESRNSFIVISILYIVLGVVLLMWPDMSLKIVCYAFGGLTFVYGLVRILFYIRNKDAVSFFKADLIIGIIATAFGIFLLLQPSIVISVLPFIIGLFIVFSGIVQFQRALDVKKVKYEKWWSILLMAVIVIVLGALIMYNPFKTATLAIMVIGLVLIVDGVSNIFSTVFTGHIVKKLTKAIEEAAEKAEVVDGEVSEEK